MLFYDSAEKRPLILPTPKILPKINIPLYYLNLFTKLYPNVSYEIKDINNKNNNNKNNIYLNNNNSLYCINNNTNNNIFFVFSINGNFNVDKNK